MAAEKNTCIPVSLFDMLQGPGNFIDGLFPRNPLKLSPTLWTDSFERILEPFRVVDHLTHGPAPQARSQLVRFGAVVAFNPANGPALHMNSERAPAAAVETGGGPNDFKGFIGFGGCNVLHVYLSNFHGPSGPKQTQPGIKFIFNLTP
jgi:hypothetical protein